MEKRKLTSSKGKGLSWSSMTMELLRNVVDFFLCARKKERRKKKSINAEESVREDRWNWWWWWWWLTTKMLMPGQTDDWGWRREFFMFTWHGGWNAGNWGGREKVRMPWAMAISAILCYSASISVAEGKCGSSLSLSLSLFPYLSIYPFPISRDREIFSQKWASHSLELHKWASPSKISSSVHEPPTLSLSLSHSRMNHTRILPFANVSIIRVW